VTAFSSEELLEALSQCDFVSDQPLKGLLNDKSLSCRMVDSVALSERLAVLRQGQKFGTYVIFRGTESRGLGTWLITNFQAASTEFRVIDEDLTHWGSQEQLVRVQGATSKIVAPGVVHQGFLRTWSQLWYGSDILDTTFHTPTSAWRLWVRYVALAGVVVALAWWVGSTPLITAMLVLIGVLFAMALESGSLERLFWLRKPARKALQKGSLLDDLAALDANGSKDPIWFVGHSLGGALATLAFAAYRNRCEHLGMRRDARLVTFASPLVGDEKFVNKFMERHGGQFVHVAYKPDPVSTSPPPSPTKLLKTAGCSLIGLWGLPLLLSSVFWAWVYPLLWEGQASYATWDETNGSLKRLRARWNYMSLFRHTRACYRRQLQAS
jgi:hypothetical protein